MFQFITDSAIHRTVVIEQIPQARNYLWLATSDLKDLYVRKGRKMVPFLEILSDLAARGVSIRLMHAKEPGPAFRHDFDKYPELIEGMERLLCPRLHAKYVIVDGSFAYAGSANLTGAGLGAKSDAKRNFESGFITTDATVVQSIMDHFDSIWMGARCESCRRKEFCAEHGETRGLGI